MSCPQITMIQQILLLRNFFFRNHEFHEFIIALQWINTNLKMHGFSLHSLLYKNASCKSTHHSQLIISSIVTTSIPHLLSSSILLPTHYSPLTTPHSSLTPHHSILNPHSPLPVNKPQQAKHQYA